MLISFLLKEKSLMAIREVNLKFSNNKILLFIKKLAFDGFYPLLCIVVLKIDFCCFYLKKKKIGTVDHL